MTHWRARGVETEKAKNKTWKGLIVRLKVRCDEAEDPAACHIEKDDEKIRIHFSRGALSIAIEKRPHYGSAPFGL